MTERWKHAGRHFLGSFIGLLSLFFSHPLFALKLLQARFYFFRNRELEEPFETPDEYCVETANELLSYWSLRVERECFRGAWSKLLSKEKAPVIVDVGANAGVFTHLLWKIKSEAEIFAFEPLPRMNQKIRTWGERNKAKLTLFQCAVSDRCGVAVFCASAENDTAASFQLSGDRREGFEVDTVTLDSILPDRPIFLIKIDVEGFGSQVLAGAEKAIKRARFLVIEAHTEEARKKLHDVLGAEWVSEQVGTSDYFFRRKSDCRVCP